MPRSRSNQDIISSLQAQLDEAFRQLGTLRQYIADINDTFTDGIDPVWNNVTSFSGAWDGTSVNYAIIFGIVYLRGTVQNGVLGTTAFTLPAGYRPGADRVFVCAGNVSSISSAVTPVQIATNGTVEPVSGDNTKVYLDGICFPAEQ